MLQSLKKKICKIDPVMSIIFFAPVVSGLLSNVGIFGVCLFAIFGIIYKGVKNRKVIKPCRYKFCIINDICV